jgi:hypothetical protein
MLHTLSLVLFCALSAFYLFLTVAFLVRSRHESCRQCFFWQTCLSSRLGFPEVKSKCTT